MDAIEHAKKLVLEPVPTEQDSLLELINQLTQCNVHVLESRTQAYQKFLEDHNRLRMPKDKDYTDFDRTSITNAAVAPLQASYEELRGLEDIINKRLDLLTAIYLERSGYVEE